MTRTPLDETIISFSEGENLKMKDPTLGISREAYRAEIGHPVPTPWTDQIIRHLKAGGKVKVWNTWEGAWVPSWINLASWENLLKKNGNQPQPSHVLIPIPAKVVEWVELKDSLGRIAYTSGHMIVAVDIQQSTYRLEGMLPPAAIPQGGSRIPVVAEFPKEESC